MNTFDQKRHRGGELSYLRWMFLVVGVMAAGAVAIETIAFSKPGAPTSMLVELNAYAPRTVSLQEWRQHRRDLNDGHVFATPCDVHLLAFVAASGNLHAGDSASVEFYANTNKIGSRTCIWHDEVNPSKQWHGRGAVPMFIRPAGFSAAEFVWHNPAPGNYALTARASYGKKVSAISTPVSVTIIAQPRER